MTKVTLIINKDEVYEEVSQTTSYTGSKMDNDKGAYERIFTTDADQSQLERFWNESCVATCETLKKFLESEETGDSKFTLKLQLSSSFDQSLKESMERELFSFFVMNIISKWYVFTNKGESGDYASSAASFLEGVHRKACYKKRPKRPTYA